MRTHLGLALLALLAGATPFVMDGCGGGGDSGGLDGGRLDGSVVAMPDAGGGDAAADATPATDGGGGPSAASACTMLGEARCKALAQCSSSAATVARWGNPTACETRLQAQCVLNLAATGTGATPASVAACAAVLASQDCNQVLANTLPEECEPVTGALPDLSPCFVSGQCQSSFCALPSGAACGLCEPSPEAGSPCATVADCGNRTDLGCASGVCVSYVAPHAACDPPYTACTPGYACTRNKDAGATVDAGQACQMMVTTAGSACDSANYVHPTCNASYGLACVASVCASVTFVDAGEACGNDLDGSVARCAASGTCMDGGLPSSKDGTCVPAAADNAACDLALGPACLPQARCVITDGSTRGICTALDNATCKQ